VTTCSCLEKKKLDDWLIGEGKSMRKVAGNIVHPSWGKHEIQTAWGLSKDEVWSASIRVMSHTRFGSWSKRGSGITVDRGQWQWWMTKKRQWKGPRSAFKVSRRVRRGMSGSCRPHHQHGQHMVGWARRGHDGGAGRPQWWSFTMMRERMEKGEGR
jgi:hypothetical protein